MNNDKLFDELFDTLLDSAAKQYDSVPEPDLPEEKTVDFSENHEKNMEKLFAAYRKRNFLLKAGRYAIRIASCMIILAVLSGITIISMDSKLITKGKNFVFNSRETSADIKFYDENELSPYFFDELILEYIPDGFSLSRVDQTGTLQCMYFENNGEELSISVCDINSTISVTNGIYSERIEINDFDCYYVEDTDISLLVTHTDDRVYIIRGLVTKDEFVKIVQNLKLNED